MPSLEEIAQVSRKIRTMFYLIDTSGSMTGSRIGAVNTAMEESIILMKEEAEANDDAEIKVAILQFSGGCSWITPASGPIGLEELIWNDLRAGGPTDFGAALKELDHKLSRHEYFNSIARYYVPVILLLSDGGPTDDWRPALEHLKQNLWFEHSIKIAIDIESGSERSVLEAFTGNPDGIINAKDITTLRKIICMVSVRASLPRSHSKRSNETIASSENDATDIVASVVNDLTQGNGASDSDDDNDWVKWW